MRLIYFTHSIVGCWNHGNAHFVRGVLRAIIALGHDVRVAEPADAWSRRHMREDAPDAEARFAARFPEFLPHVYGPDDPLDEVVDGVDCVIVHEWTDPAIVARLGALRDRGRFTLLFHDTHHRAVSDPAAMRAYELRHYDAILAFGQALAAVYRAWGFARVHVWHEAADVTLFRPPEPDAPRNGVVWIGNFGDDERTQELREFLLAPVRDSGETLDVYGVRYPAAVLGELAAGGVRYHGWLANADAPTVFARHRATVHVPRRVYAQTLCGIPTIRVFEALACGIPLICAPWQDCEQLFREGDFLRASTGAEVAAHLRTLREEPAAARAMAERGLETIRARHTCAHRARELLGLLA